MKPYKFSVEERKRLTKQIIVLVDSREKKNGHILEYFQKQGIAYQVSRLEYGDYSFMIPAAAAGGDIFFHRDCVVERKASLEELSGNLTGERERFEKEFLKAGDDGCLFAKCTSVRPIWGTKGIREGVNGRCKVLCLLVSLVWFTGNGKVYK